jgi:hypothetical protein
MKRIPVGALLLSVGGLLFALARIAFLEEAVRQDIAASERSSAPDLLIEDIASVQYPDPLHLRLPDGRVFRYAHLACPDAGTPEYANALEAAAQPLADRNNLKLGLRRVGSTPSGEPLVEPWGFQVALAACGCLSEAERQTLRVPHWNNLTGQLVRSGCFWLAPGVTDPALLAVERAARNEGVGVWADPAYLRRLVDLAEADAILQRPAEGRDERLESAALLLRADPADARARLMALIGDHQEADLSLRIQLAHLLEKSGDREGTEFLRRTLTGIEAYALHEAENAFANGQAAERENAAIQAHNRALRR